MRYPFGEDPHEDDEGWYDKLWMWHEGKMPEMIATDHTEPDPNPSLTVTAKMG